MPEYPDLPLELSDNIIDHLWDDSDSLATCTLVCRAWLPSARTHLFDTVKLVPRKWDDYAEEMQALHRICPFVRTLKLHRVPETLDDRLIPHFHAMGRVNTLVLAFYLLGAYDNLVYETFNARLARLPPVFIRSIKNLKIAPVVLRPVEFTEVFSIFRHISVLDISLSVSRNGKGLPINDPPLGMAITRLTYRRFPPTLAAQFLTWLSSESNGRYPHTLRLLVNGSEVGVEPHLLYSPMLHQMGVSLQHLWLTRSHFNDDSRKDNPRQFENDSSHVFSRNVFGISSGPY